MPFSSRAQTARSVAKTAEIKAEEAKKVSDQARAIATEFASDFVQMGKFYSVGWDILLLSIPV